MNIQKLKEPFSNLSKLNDNTVAVLNPVMADAIRVKEERMKKLDDLFKDQEKQTEDFIKKNQERLPQSSFSPEIRKMKLSESLFEDLQEKEYFTTDTEEADLLDKILAWYRDSHDDRETYEWLKNFDLTDDRIEFFTGIESSELDEGCHKNHLEETLVSKEIDNLSQFKFWGPAEQFVEKLTTEELDTMTSTIDELYPNGINETLLNDIFAYDRDWVAKCLGYEDAEEIYERLDEAVEPEKKRTRVIEPKDETDDDKWTQVYNNLAADLPPSEIKNCPIKTEKGERYNSNSETVTRSDVEEDPDRFSDDKKEKYKKKKYTGGALAVTIDGDLIIYAAELKDFDLARRVADHFGLLLEEPKKDTNRATNRQYKFSAKLHMPKV